MSAIHDLIAQVSDPRLRERLAAEWASASKEKKFGLVFEDHLPELLPLYKARPRRGDLVCRRDGSLKDVWQVQQIKDGMATCIKPGDAAQASPARATEHGVAQALVRWAVDELLVVRQFGEPIFPSLVPVDAVANGPAEAPWHTLIEADNYHALQLLEYLGKATVVGRSPCGAVIAKYLVDKVRMPATCWSRPTHNAETFGSNLLRDILGDKRFPYPKCCTPSLTAFGSSSNITRPRLCWTSSVVLEQPQMP